MGVRAIWSCPELALFYDGGLEREAYCVGLAAGGFTPPDPRGVFAAKMKGNFSQMVMSFLNEGALGRTGINLA